MSQQLVLQGPDTEGALRSVLKGLEIQKTLGTEPVLLVLRTTSQVDTPVMPLPVDTAGIPNDHLQYAITWFALAVVWLGMTAVMILRITRRKD